jgi:hypothetical protein
MLLELQTFYLRVPSLIRKKIIIQYFSTKKCPASLSLSRWYWKVNGVKGYMIGAFFQVKRDGNFEEQGVA